MRALIAEDEFISRKVLAKLLEPLFETDVVVNGQEAVEAFRLAHQEGRPYDVILMDIMMPVMDGITATKTIREMEQADTLRPRAKIIMVTALDDPKTVIRSFHEGEATAYVVKPLERDKIFAELEKIGLLGK